MGSSIKRDNRSDQPAEETGYSYGFLTDKQRNLISLARELGFTVASKTDHFKGKSKEHCISMSFKITIEKTIGQEDLNDLS